MSDNEKDLATIPFYAHEFDMNKLEKSNNRLWIVVILLILAFIGSNTAWLVYENSFQDVVTTTQEITQDSGDGGSNTYTGDFIGGDYIGETNN